LFYDHSFVYSFRQAVDPVLNVLKVDVGAVWQSEQSDGRLTKRPRVGIRKLTGV